MSSYYDLTNAQRARVRRLQNGKIIKTKFGFCRHVVGNVFVYTSYTNHGPDLVFRDSEDSAENCYRAMIADESHQSIKRLALCFPLVKNMQNEIRMAKK